MSNRRATVPKRASEIVGEFERRISTGRLQPGGRVPTVRALSDELGVAPATVASAYRQLAERGTLVSRGRLGTFVAARPALGAATPTAVPDGVVDLASGSPDPNLLPRLARRAPDRPVLYGAPQVHPALAHTAAEWLRRNRLSHGHLAVVGGAMDGVERLLQTYLRPGDAVAVEDPGYPNVVDIARGLGLAPVPVPVDGAGVSVDALRAVLRRVQAVVLTPRALNPTGAHLTPARARLLHEALAAYPELLVIEDDHAGEVAGVPLHSVGHGLARWAVVHSVAKSLGPDLRLALVAGDEGTVERLQARQRLGAGWVSHELQRMVATAYGDDATLAALHRARDIYAERRTALIDALAGEGVVASAASGLNVWIPVAEEATVCTALLGAGYAVTPGARFRHHSDPAVRITVSRLVRRDARTIASAIARALRTAAWAAS